VTPKPRVDLAEFRTAFVAEADEQLAMANAKLLLIEESQKRGDKNPRAVRDVFRALHTVKGLAAMVGVEPIVAIAHKMESALRDADRAGGALPRGSVDVLLEGVRAIDHRVRALDRGAPVPEPPRPLLAALDSLESYGAASNATPRRLLLDAALDEKLAPFEREQLLRAGDEGHRALRMEFAPSPERAEAGFTINSVRDRLGAIAEIVKVLPRAVPPSAGAATGLVFVLLVTTAATDDDLAAAGGVARETIASVVDTEGTAGAASVTNALANDTLDGDGDLAPDALDVPEGPRGSILRVDVALVDDAMDRLAALLVTRSRIGAVIAKMKANGVDTREVGQIVHENARQLRDLRKAILQVRMVPVAEILDRMRLVVRGARRDTGKSVRLEVDTGGAELDKSVAERVFPAIVHLVRNAIDHGIESPSDRVRAGKPEEGVIRIASIARANTRVELSVQDDGRGIDREALAKRSGRSSSIEDAALLDLLCEPGFTTKDEATTTSGRGLGMDIARRIVVDQLGGELEVRSELGVGTTFIMKIPLTIAIIDAFALECGGAGQRQKFVVPVSMVEEIIEIDRARVVPLPGETRDARIRVIGMVERRGETMPLLDLAGVLGMEPSVTAAKAVVVRRGGEPIAFVLDRVLGQQEAVVRPLVDPLVQVPGVPGATDLGDGRLTLVLDLVALSASRTRPLRTLDGGSAAPALLGAKGAA
jgi:two-component system chemotaxis sensor kinase CheA